MADNIPLFRQKKHQISQSQSPTELYETAQLGMCFQSSDDKVTFPYCFTTMLELILNSILISIVIFQIIVRIKHKQKILKSKSNILYFLCFFTLIAFEVFQADTSLFSAFYVYVLFKNIYFLMLIFIFGEKILKDSNNRCFKQTFRVMYILSFVFYLTMFVLNLVNLSKDIYWLPCKSPFLEAVRFFEFSLGLCFLFMRKYFIQKIQSERELQTQFLDQLSNHEILEQKEYNIKLLIIVNISAEFIYLIVNFFYIFSTDKSTCNYIPQGADSYQYVNGVLSLLEKIMTYFAPVITQIYVYWIPYSKVKHQSEDLEKKDIQTASDFQTRYFDNLKYNIKKETIRTPAESVTPQQQGLSQDSLQNQKCKDIQDLNDEEDNASYLSNSNIDYSNMDLQYRRTSSHEIKQQQKQQEQTQQLRNQL